MIILLTGKAATGKSTVADYLERYYGFQQDQLAAPLKRLTSDIFQVPMEILNPETPENRLRREAELDDWPDWTPRKLLQFIGTELFRTQIRDDIWVRSLWLRVSRLGGNWTIPDVRFPNEQSFFTDRLPNTEVVTFNIVRPGYEGGVGLKGHASESHVLSYDYQIDNDADFSCLYQQVDAIMATLGPKVKVQKMIPLSA